MLLALALALALAPLSLPAAAHPTAALIVSGSRYWHNYRHSANALAFHSALRRLGAPEDAIGLLLAADAPHACDARNTARCAVRSDASQAGSLLPSAPSGGGGLAPLEVDLAGAPATAGALLRALTGRLEPGEGGSGSLAGLERAAPGLRLLLVLTGHGGDGYLKFHDKEELSYADLAGALREAHAGGRYERLLIVADTCQAASLGAALRAAAVPWATLVSSSRVGENSYATGMDGALGVSLADGFSRAAGVMLAGAVEGGGWRASGQAAAAAAAAAARGGGARAPPALAEACSAPSANASAGAACAFAAQWRARRGGAAVDALYAGAAMAAGAAGGGGVGQLLRAQAWVDERSTVGMLRLGAHGEELAGGEGGEEEPLLSFFAP